jgi:carboxymethylenebutenolidase
MRDSRWLGLIIWSGAVVLAAVRTEYVPTPGHDPDTVVVRSGSLSLRGVLWTPAGKGPFPAVLFNHGSYAHGDTLTSQDLGALGPVFREARIRLPVLVPALEGEELNEAIAGLAFLRALSQVDPRRIAVSGHSFGGSLTLFLAARDTTLRAAVIFSGSARSWGPSPKLRAALLAAPLRCRSSAGRTRLTIYPAFGRTSREGHNFLFRAPRMWEADVFAFLDSMR